MLGLMMDYPLTIDKMVKRANQVFPHKEIVSVMPSGRRHRYTYHDLYERVVRLMNVLRKLGVKEGDRIATFMWNHFRHLELYFAIPSLGAVTHTINVRLSEEQLEYIINHAEDSLLFVDASLLQALEPMAGKMPTVRQIIVVTEDGVIPETSFDNVLDFEALMAQADDTVDFPEFDERTACGMCYTSGTTGNPKGVMYTHRGIFLHTLMTGFADMYGLRERDVLMPVVPMFHANAWSAPYVAAMVGCKLVYAGSDVSPEALLPLIREEGVTSSLGVPTIWNGVLQHLAKHGGDLGDLKTLVVGGSSAPRAMIETFQKKYGVEFVHAWGMTEMSPLGTMNRLQGRMQDWSEARQFGALSRVGIPGPLVEVRIMGDDGEEMPWDGQSAGELEVRGPAVVSSYYNNPAAAGQFSDDGWFRTGDVATVDENALVQITDRTKDLIKSGGEWISSVEMENLLMALPNVLEAAVVARPDAKWDERPVAFIVPTEAGPPTNDEVRAHLASAFAKWQLPVDEDIRVIAQIPKTSVGKFDKKVLRSQMEGA